MSVLSARRVAVGRQGPAEVGERPRRQAALHRRVDRPERLRDVVVVHRDRRRRRDRVGERPAQQLGMPFDVGRDGVERDRALAAVGRKRPRRARQHVGQHLHAEARLIARRIGRERRFDVRPRARHQNRVADEDHRHARHGPRLAIGLWFGRDAIAIHLDAHDADVVDDPSGHANRADDARRILRRRIHLADRARPSPPRSDPRSTSPARSPPSDCRRPASP